MKVFGVSLFEPREAEPAGTELALVEKDIALSTVRGGLGGFLGVIRESFAGAWQKNIECESCENIAAFGAVYACVTRIAADISKLRIKLVERDADGIWSEVERASPLAAVLKKPNRYQTRIQFLSSWIVSKLLYGNAYILKERDNRGGLNNGVVTALHVLDPRLVSVLTGTDGSVWYQLRRDDLAQVPESLADIPAEWIIHDRTATFFHPLIGTSPIFACGASATQGRRIQANSAKFFENMSRPSGQLTAPGKISPETEARLKAAFEQNFSGGNIGRLLVSGDGLKYEPMTIPANDAQLIQQLEWTVKDVAACFHMPLYKINAGPAPSVGNFGALNQSYYDETLHELIEAIELLLDEGLGLVDVPDHIYGTELDIDALLRMDPGGRADYAQKMQGILAPNELRLRENYGPVDGGEAPLAQQQNFSLTALAKRDAKADPFATAAPPHPAPPVAAPAPPPAEPPPKASAVDFVKALVERFNTEELLVD